MTLVHCVFEPGGHVLETPTPPAKGDTLPLPDGGDYRVAGRRWLYPGLAPDGQADEGTVLEITVEPAGGPSRAELDEGQRRRLRDALAHAAEHTAPEAEGEYAALAAALGLGEL